ncbi:MAG: UDP-3-O-acyl-N-acetylglucosamine deacetylase [Armatimonadota bacterium]
MTIARELLVAGAGIHTGAQCAVRLTPASVGTGYHFRHPGTTGFRANPGSVVDTRRCTVVADGDTRVSTVEHLLSACAGLGIDDVSIEVDGPELPILDGSALPWVELLREAGTTGEPAEAPRLRETIEVVGDDGAFAIAAPNRTRPVLDVHIDFDHPVVGKQRARAGARTDYARDIAPARTFGFREEVDRLLAAGLAQGASLENAVVVEATGYSVALRFRNEPARHKLLDLIGDLALAGPLPRASIVAHRPSHRLNNALARALAAACR